MKLSAALILLYCGSGLDKQSQAGLKLEGRATIEGEWAGRVTGLGSQHVEIAMMVTPMVTAGSRFRDFSPLLLSQITGLPL